MSPAERPILLILDIDETLVYAAETRLDRPDDFRVGPYSVYRRPGVQDFLTACLKLFEIAVWSSAGADYVDAMVQALFPAEQAPSFVWSRDRCVQRYDPERLERYFVKDLKKVKRLGFDLNRVLVVDDSSEKVERNYGNAVYVRPYYGDPGDRELPRLAWYLQSLASTPNVRAIEKRGWRDKVPASTEEIPQKG
ncbi:MAG TPA: HAD family hydrolase [Planctomycetaceae bacterium]|nr:HAD family hydrolase [Planctomycetaceae bacterium]